MALVIDVIDRQGNACHGNLAVFGLAAVGLLLF
jgi:hypothetical protein